MPEISEMFPSKYLKAADLDEDMVLTIDTVRQEEVGRGSSSDRKWVVYFIETKKGLVLNKTNAQAITKLYGSNTDDWAGQQVILYATEVSFQGDMVDAIRIRTKLPKKGDRPVSSSAKPMTQAEADDDIPPF